MAIIKDVYVIKVKTRPPLSSLYPSERRYSASTVGGLSLVHFGLGILAFALGTLAGCLQGPVLALACLVPFVSGLLAWRKWYIDRNVSLFFYGSLFSLAVSLLCGAATLFDIAAVARPEISGTVWRLENVFAYSEVVGRFRVPENESSLLLPFNDTGSMEVSFFPHWRRGADEFARTNLLLDINVLVTCVLEVSWSILSLRISLRGMRNGSTDNSYDDHRNPEQKLDDSGGPAPQRTKYRAPDPLEERGDDVYEENLRYHVCVSDNSVPRLPLPESSKEFRERVERFLANQATHRIVEGSCS